MTQQLKPGEHVDLDSGISVRRTRSGESFVVSASGGGRTHRVEMSIGDVRAIAVLAGLKADND